MADRFRVSTQLARKLAELGVSPESVLRHARLPTGLFAQEKITVSTEELFALYRGIAGTSDDPAIGLKIGTEPRVERYDPIALTAVSARSLRDALARLARYKQLTCPEELCLSEQGSECRVRFRWLLAEETEPPVLTDLCFAWVVGIARRGTGDQVAPLRLELRGAARDRRPGQGDPEAAVGRPASAYRHRRPRAAAEPTHSPASAGGSRGVVPAAGRGRPPRAGAPLPAALPLELNETAYLLGYEDSHSFFRAFHDWEGTPPGAWRARHAPVPTQP